MSVVTTEMQDQVTELYITYFGRAPDAEGFGFWTQALANGATVMEIGNDFAKSPEFVQAYGGLTPEQQVNRFYQNVLDRDGDAGGLEYWSGLLENGASFASVAYAIVNTAFVGGEGVAEADTALVRNKVEVGKYFAIDLQSNDFAVASSAFETVTSDPESVPATKARLDEQVEADTTFELTTGVDNLVGTNADNLFEARVVQNPLGEQVNEFASGDRIDGLGGIDTLSAKVQAASIAEGGAAGRINAETKSVEIAHFEAVPNTSGSAATDAVVNIDAGDMWGLTNIGSVESDASLRIYDLTTLTNSGAYADRRDESEVTIRMDHTGNGGVVDVASNLEVYFDQNYISPGNLASSSAFWFLLDQNADENNQPPLTRINVDGIRGTVGGTEFRLRSDAIGGNDSDVTTWDEFVAALQDPLAQLIADGTLPAGTTLTVDESNTDFTFLDNGVLSSPIPAITLAVTNSPEVVVATGFSQIQDAPGAYNVYGEIQSQESQNTTPTIATIELDKVGRGSDGGELVVGGMSNDGTNTFNSGSGSVGIQRFEITVEGDQTQPSDLSSLRSTNNTLEEVVVVSAEGSTAALTIGNSNTEGDAPNGATLPATGDNSTGPTTGVNNALKDVRLFDVTGLASSVEAHAYLSNEVVAKYMDLTDGQTNAAADNANFIYTLSGGDDTLNINLDKSNLAASGTANREDFTFNVLGNAGDDTILVQIGDSIGNDDGSLQNWYSNTLINQNLTINGNDGNDTVLTYGASAFVINAGAGNDLVITDNSGVRTRVDGDVNTVNTFNEGKATFVFNVVPTTGVNIDNLLSESRLTTGTGIAQTSVIVNFMGVTATAIVGDTANAGGGDVNDLIVRQAIKEAINNDEYLSDLLIAEDGPSGALVVRALTDGFRTSADLQIGFDSALNSAQAALPAADQPTVLGGNLDAALGDRFGTTRLAEQNDGGGVTALRGEDSSEVANNNAVFDGTGLDTIVLSTASVAEQVELANDGQVDLIVNFDINDSVTMEDGTQITSRLNANGATELTIPGGEGENPVVEALLTNESRAAGKVQVAGIFVAENVNPQNNIDIDGSALADDITGNNSNNEIRGGNGNDTITGSGGSDDLVGNAGDNTFVQGTADSVAADSVNLAGATFAGGDIIDFSSGVDVIADFTAGVEADVLDLVVGTQAVTAIGVASAALAAGTNYFLSGSFNDITGDFTVAADGAGADTLIVQGYAGVGTDITTNTSSIVLVGVDSDNLAAANFA